MWKAIYFIAAVIAAVIGVIVLGYFKPHRNKTRSYSACTAEQNNHHELSNHHESEEAPSLETLEMVIDKYMHGRDSLPYFIDGMLSSAERGDVQNFSFYRAQLKYIVGIIAQELAEKGLPGGSKADFFKVAERIALFDDMGKFLEAAKIELREYSLNHTEIYLGMKSVFPHFPQIWKGE